MVHPLFGSTTDIITFIHKAHTLSIRVLIDLDVTGFTPDSNYYNYDLSSYPSPFGPLFQNTSSFPYHNTTSKTVDLGEDYPMNTMVSNLLFRYSYVLGFDGVYWKGLLCLRLDSRECEQGEGSDNEKAVRFLRSMSASIPFLFGEDTRGVVSVKNPDSMVRDITASTSQHGLGFRGALDESM